MLFSIYLCLFIFLISCDNGKDSDIPEFHPASDITSGDISDSLVARIYFDATLSMQGFVVPGSTRYTRICLNLESVIVSGWRDEKVDFFRFGEQVEPINRGTYLQAGYESFYEQEHISRKTFIQKIIDHEEQLANARMGASSTPENTATSEIDVNDTPETATEGVTPTEAVEAHSTENQLVVIVTDLFQDDSDITLLINHLKEKYIKKGHDVGLFGLRSQFDGTVYDIGIGEGSSMPYRSNPGNPETFRPFYLLVLGKHADIAHYFDRLIANGFSEAQTIIFSRYLVSPLLSFEGASIEKDNLNRKIINSDHSQNPRLEQYVIWRETNPAKIRATLEYTLLPHAMVFDSDTLMSSISAKHAPMGETEPSLNAWECLKVTSKHSRNEESNELIVDFSFDSQSLHRNGVYLYEVTLSPNVDTFQTPEWCSEWDMGDERNGAKTLNLVNFVRNLSLVTARMHHPQIATFYCYIKKR